MLMLLSCSWPRCISEVKNWIFVKRLKLNDDKNEIILINPNNFQIYIDSLYVGEEIITFSKFAKI